MSLVKKARGLQRFMLDCGFWRSRKWSGATLEEIGLQTAAVSYCYEHGTDGLLPGPGFADLALALGVRERETAKVVPKMVESHRWRRKKTGYEIVGFLDHNPSTAEVEEYRSKRQAAGAKGNHDRWHKDRFDPNCDFCVLEDLPEDGSQVRSPPDSHEPSDSIASSGSKAVDVVTTPLPPAKRGASGSPRATGTNPRALAERAEAERRQHSRDLLEGCAACEGKGVIEQDDGSFLQCFHARVSA